ncbi:MAG: ABC transporter permease, partial [Rhizomicrobium sp.]
MIWLKLTFGGFGRRFVEAMAAGIVLAAASATVAASLMVVEGARNALTRAVHQDRPDIVQVKSRFNRAVFETPRSGNLPPLTIPVYEPLIDPVELESAAGNNQVIKRQSLLRNVVSGDSFLNIYIFGIDPDLEREVSSFSFARGRFLRSGDQAVAVLDQASARALGVDIGGAFPVRKADGDDLQLTVVGILDKLDLRGAPPRTAEAPSLMP